jgi:hypothetical protein
VTRWLEAAKSVSPAPTQPTKPDKTQAGVERRGVLSGFVGKVGRGETENRNPPTPAAAPRADGLDADAGAYLDFLRLHGPATYGAAAAALGWGATRTWQAEARLRAAGLVTVADPLGQAVPVGGNP